MITRETEKLLSGVVFNVGPSEEEEEEEEEEDRRFGNAAHAAERSQGALCFWLATSRTSATRPAVWITRDAP